jgi:hypothetical protein
MAKSDVMASTHKERKQKKVISHIEIHPAMDGGHRVETHHTHSFEHPPTVKEFGGLHEAVEIPKGHVLHHVAQEMGIPTKVGQVGAGSEENVESKEGESI